MKIKNRVTHRKCANKPYWRVFDSLFQNFDAMTLRADSCLFRNQQENSPNSTVLNWVKFISLVVMGTYPPQCEGSPAQQPRYPQHLPDLL